MPMNDDEFKEFYIKELSENVFPGYLDKWWQLARPALNGMSPEQLARTPQGRDALINLLNNLKRGVN